MSAPYYNAARMADVTRRGATLSQLAGAAGFAGGAAVIAGWILGIRVLTQPVLSIPSMKLNAAIGLAAAGAALWCLATGRIRAGRVLAWFVTALGAAALSQDFFGWNLGIDQWLIADPTALDGFHPGRMSPLLAFCLIALGWSLTVSGRKDRAWPSQGAALAAGIVPVMSLVSYALGLHQLYGLASYRAMALHAAVLLLTLAVGVISLQPAEGLVGLLARDTIGGKAVRWILPPTIIIPVIFEWLRLVGQRRGLYETGPGVALFVVCTVVLLSVVVVLTAKLIDDADAKRRDAEDALRKSNETLESRVAEKTAEAQRGEARLQAGQRMEAMGRLAGGVAHDFNNMMTVVSGYSELLLGRISVDDPSRKSLLEIKKAGERCAALTRHLLAFSRRQILTPVVVDVNRIVADLCDMLPVLLGEDVRVIYEPGPDLWPVRADQAQLEQVIVNLAVNARDAMPRGGTLTIVTANVELAADAVAAHPEIIAGPFVRLTVRDSGHGMDATTRARVFDPFFTTKPVGEGTGLGLSTVYGVIKQSGGYIYVDSEPDKGAAFNIYLPRVPLAAAAQAMTAPSGTAVSNGRETVLLVEDEASVRLLLSDVLEEAGYRVIAAADGHQALRICEQFSEPIHLLITDVVMPGLSGCELAERLGPIRPGMRILLVSGYAENVVLQHAISRPGTTYLQKPFMPDTLLKRIREELAGIGQ